MVSGGERGHDVLAALVSVDDAELTAERISAAVAELVPPHMIPRQLQVVAAIPFTVGGKTDRRAAAGQLAALVQAADGAGRAQPETTPATAARTPGTRCSAASTSPSSMR
ncbi:hypothetical protein [Mycolicibacterium mucogenicum]|uniref:hypothetical protein n=1 Tax=Mycolicibacterium mucogenicum TaxID=56689 RepID=UPI00399B187F